MKILDICASAFWYCDKLAPLHNGAMEVAGLARKQGVRLHRFDSPREFGMTMRPGILYMTLLVNDCHWQYATGCQ